MSTSMVTVTISDRTLLEGTGRGAPAILIGSAEDHVTLLFHGDKVAAIDRLVSELYVLRWVLTHPEAAEADEGLAVPA